MSLYPHRTAQAQHQLCSLSTVNPPLVLCRRQCERRQHSIAANFHAERSSPYTAGDIHISNYTILNTFKLERIGLFAAHPDVVNPLSVLNPTLTMIGSKAGTRSPTFNIFKTSPIQCLNQRHLLCRGPKHSPVPVLQ
jgi:hypothetical protein